MFWQYSGLFVDAEKEFADKPGLWTSSRKYSREYWTFEPMGEPVGVVPFALQEESQKIHFRWRLNKIIRFGRRVKTIRFEKRVKTNRLERRVNKTNRFIWRVKQMIPISTTAYCSCSTNGIRIYFARRRLKTTNSRRCQWTIKLPSSQIQYHQ